MDIVEGLGIEIQELKDKNEKLKKALIHVNDYVAELLKDEAKHHYPDEYHHDMAAEIKYELYELLK